MSHDRRARRDSEPPKTSSSPDSLGEMLKSLKEEYWHSLEEDREPKTRERVQYIGFSLGGQPYVLFRGMAPGPGREPRGAH